MARNFPCFLTAFEQYAKDGFFPDRFYEWIGRSILAAAVERKITLNQGRIHYVPNLYVLLVSHPGGGKTTAINSGVDLIEEIQAQHNPDLNIIHEQTTEPAFIESMKIEQRLQTGPTSFEYAHSSGFFYASEASASALQNVCGNFTAALTLMYDCPKVFRKKIKGEKHETKIKNACMNVLAGTTFDFLKTMVNETSAMGGFASRLIYVVETERKVRKSKWGASQELDSTLGRKLVEDLVQIHKLYGPMVPTKGFTARYEEWSPKFDQEQINLNSPALEAINARKNNSLIKLSMLLSISESNALIVTEEHFDRALTIIEDVYKDTPQILIMAAMANKQSQSGANQVIMQTLKKNGGEMTLSALKGAVLSNGNPVDLILRTIDYMMGSGIIAYDASTLSVKLLIEPNSNF